ncbi:hypothetical protein CPB84DRAFT_445206 [Gymnopilus junonius]|uniref:Uncharacterized protein n=1 Tax=Gymnopilus junonius TaxID=109634 RepID=A0A9P5NA67_GYMJU|nr:hypothetical protein CPB84DRAFT_445206 [Gymnopilus junonius]
MSCTAHLDSTPTPSPSIPPQLPPSPPPSSQSIPTPPTSSQTACRLQPSHSSNTNGCFPHPSTPPSARPQRKRDLTTSQILSVLLPTVIWPVHIGYEFDLDDVDECQSLLARLKPGFVDGDNDPWLDHLVRPPGQRRSADPGPSKQRKSVRVDEDEDMHMADVEDAAEPCSSLNAVKPSEGRKGKEKATQAAGDAETESAWPVASRRPAILTNSTPRSKARLPSGTRGRGGSSSNTNGRNSSGSGRGSASEASPTSKCISNTSSSGSFSPVDWTKMKDGQEVQALKLSPNATLILKPGDPNGNSGIANSTNPNQTSPGISIGSIKDPHAPAMSPSASRQSVIPPQAMVPSRSYTLPPPPEGSIAALRQETQGLAYPNSYVYGSKEDGGEEERVEMVIGADAGERMLSPESQDSGGGGRRRKERGSTSRIGKRR